MFWRCLPMTALRWQLWYTPEVVESTMGSQRLHQAARDRRYLKTSKHGMDSIRDSHYFRTHRMKQAHNRIVGEIHCFCCVLIESIMSHKLRCSISPCFYIGFVPWLI